MYITFNRIQIKVRINTNIKEEKLEYLKDRRESKKKKIRQIKLEYLKRIINIVEHLNNNEKGATIVGLKIICKNAVNILSVSKRTQIIV